MGALKISSVKPLLAKPRQSLLRVGLVSVTFRRLPPETIAQEAADAGLGAIEWGGDVHAPHGDIHRARQIGAWSRDLGLDVSYGSYYRVGESEAQGLAFEAVLGSTIALGAKMVRVWAGSRGPEAVEAAGWGRVVEDAQRIAAMAATHEVTIAFERHANTLTATPDAHRQLLERLPSPNIATFWQPDFCAPVEENAGALRNVLSRLTTVHVFNYNPPTAQFLPLSASGDTWLPLLSILRESPRSHDLMIEFVADGSFESLRADAAVLLRWIEAAPPLRPPTRVGRRHGERIP